jgi:hypothetical protein
MGRTPQSLHCKSEEAHGDHETKDRLGFAPTSAVPEPASIVLFGLGVAGICDYGWKRRKVTA